MINRLQLLRNVGLFDSVNAGASIPLGRLTLIYAENGRGKTTLAAILRSLATGDTVPIAERRRLAAQHPPHVVLDCDGGPPAAIFQNNGWNRTVPNMTVFDDVFVDQNVYSGLVVEAEHRQHLHELIVGAQLVTLNQQLQLLIAQVEAHNASLRAKAAEIPATERGTLSVDEFCALPARADIDAEIHAAEQSLAAAREQEPIRNASAFEALSLPSFDVADLDHLLGQDLPTLDAVTASRVQSHIAELGAGGETWVADGMRQVTPIQSGQTAGTCPFCAQDLTGSAIMNHYRAYFSAGYSELKRTVSDAVAALTRAHGGGIPAAFERAVRVAGERRQFWSRFCDVPAIDLDTAKIAQDWQAARDAVAAALAAKQASPLDPAALSEAARAALDTYEVCRRTVAAVNQQLQQANVSILLVKERAAVGNSTVIAADLTRLRAIRARHDPTTATLCTDYMAEKVAKAQTEQQRDQARTALDQHRSSLFPAYETAMNIYLGRFNAGFRLDSVTSVNTRGGPACTYNVVINNTPVAVAGSAPAPGEPSFRNTLSAGDRSTLALAFFFASLDQDPALASKVVVIDDPISSLDEHRALTTVQEMRRLADRLAQVIVLSHNKPFLCRIWEGADPTTRTALEVARDGAGSTLHAWDVNQDCITEHDRRHASLREYVASNTRNNRDVARSIRPVLEAFIRVAYPAHFPPGTLLGSFRNLCQQRVGTAQEILGASDTQELRDVVEYANKFHHDTNPAWETEAVNDAELLGFVQRTLSFTRR